MERQWVFYVWQILFRHGIHHSSSQCKKVMHVEGYGLVHNHLMKDTGMYTHVQIIKDNFKYTDQISNVQKI